MTKIGIGITTTPNRVDTWQNSWQFHNAYRPEGSVLCINYDDDYEGVAKSKNKCLAYLYEQGCTDIFLFDDDCYPIKDNWWLPYVEHPEPHLMYQFKLPNKPSNDMQEVYRDDKTVAYSHTRGAMIYIERRVLDVVGGFDEAYGLYGYEHPDFTNRIHNAGLTTHRAMDVPNSHELFYCLDQDGKIESSILDKDRQASMRKNYLYYRANRNSRAYKEYK